MNTAINRFGFYVLLLAVCALMLVTALPFLQAFIMALVVALATAPLYDRLARLVRYPGLASILSVLVIVLLAIIPLYLFVALSIAQFAGFAPQAQAFIQTYSFADIAAHPLLQSLAPGADISGFLQTITDSSVGFLKGLLVPLVATSTTAVIHLILFIIMLAFMYPTKDRLIAYVKDLMPLPPEDAASFVDGLIATAATTLQSSLAAALVQAFLSFAAYLVIGIPAPLFWLFAVFIAAVLPFGSGVVNIPIVLVLAATGNMPAALGLLAWQVIIVSNADNLVRMEMLSRSAVRLPELLTLLSTLGGLVTFGFLGIIYGPLIAVMFVSVLELWRQGR
jgi:predicted PurR-regulated permease PerM